MPNIDPTKQQAWVDALNSGEYPQGRMQLRTLDNHYCCWGVLGDLAVKAGVASWEERAHGYALVMGEEVDAASPPAALLNWIGASDAISKYGDIVDINSDAEQLESKTLIFYNDHEKDGKTFPEIAEVISQL